MTSLPTHLFVYGTLLAEAEHPMGDLLRRHATEIGAGHIQAKLYIIDEVDGQGPNSFPAAVPSPRTEDIVHGKVYRLDAPEALIERFNDFEACAPGWPEPYEFLLRPVDVTLAHGEKLRAASYLYTWDTSRATEVPTGRYTKVSPEVR